MRFPSILLLLLLSWHQPTPPLSVRSDAPHAEIAIIVQLMVIELKNSGVEDDDDWEEEEEE